LKEGARVAITGANPETLDAARKDLGNDVLVISSDAGNLAAQQALAKNIREALEDWISSSPTLVSSTCGPSSSGTRRRMTAPLRST